MKPFPGTFLLLIVMIFCAVFQPLKAQDTLSESPPGNIYFDSKRWENISFGKDSVDKLKVLFQLFPAPIQKNSLDYNDDDEVAYWVCSSCKQLYFADENSLTEDTVIQVDTLPFYHNYTQIINQKYFTDANGVPSCLIDFSTSREFPACGRFSSGLLSMAILKKQPDWKVTVFNPFVNYQGSFSTAHAPNSVLILPNHEELFILNGGIANGPPWQDYNPVFSHLYFFESAHCSEILKITDTDCWNNGFDIGSQWKSAISTYTTSSDSIGITITIKGKIDKKNMWTMPEELMKLNPKEYKHLPRKFHFEIAYDYYYCKGKAVLKSSRLKL